MLKNYTFVLHKIQRVKQKIKNKICQQITQGTNFSISPQESKTKQKKVKPKYWKEIDTHEYFHPSLNQLKQFLNK